LLTLLRDLRFRLRTEENDTQDILDMLLNAAVFIYIGAIIDWKQYVPGNNTLELNAWRVVVLSMLSECTNRAGLTCRNMLNKNWRIP
jgi:NhaP-type Na+/H+ or K+/H+ antiporter